MYERVKVVFCCTFHITGQTKLKFLLRLLLIFPFHEEVQSSEVVNKLKDSSLFFLACHGFGMHSETTTFSQTNDMCYRTDLAAILFYISLWLSRFLHKLDFLLDLSITQNVTVCLSKLMRYTELLSQTSVFLSSRL